MNHAEALRAWWDQLSDKTLWGVHKSLNDLDEKYDPKSPDAVLAALQKLSDNGLGLMVNDMPVWDVTKGGFMVLRNFPFKSASFVSSKTAKKVDIKL